MLDTQHILRQNQYTVSKTR